MSSPAAGGRLKKRARVETEAEAGLEDIEDEPAPVRTCRTGLSKAIAEQLSCLLKLGTTLDAACTMSYTKCRLQPVMLAYLMCRSSRCKDAEAVP